MNASAIVYSIVEELVMRCPWLSDCEVWNIGAGPNHLMDEETILLAYEAFLEREKDATSRDD